VGLTNFLGSVAAYFTVNNFGRRSILLQGHFFMALFHILLGISILLQWNMIAVAMVLLFVFTFQITEGPVLWIYSAEVCYDSAFGVVNFSLFFNMFIISIGTEYLLAGLGPSGTFFFFGVASLSGALLILF